MIPTLSLRRKGDYWIEIQGRRKNVWLGCVDLKIDLKHVRKGKSGNRTQERYSKEISTLYVKWHPLLTVVFFLILPLRIKVTLKLY